MQRDMDLVREILRYIENHTDMGNNPMEIPGYTEEQISYHVKIMHQAGLIEAIDFSSHNGESWAPRCLTWEGHEFLDNANNEKAWNKAKGIVAKNGVSASFDLMKDLLVRLVVESLKM